MKYSNTYGTSSESSSYSHGSSIVSEYNKQVLADYRKANFRATLWAMGAQLLFALWLYFKLKH